MHSTGGSEHILQETECNSKKEQHRNAPTPVTSDHARYKQSPVCDYIPDRIWKKFNNIRIAPFCAIRNKGRQKNMDLSPYSWSGKSDGI